METGAFALNFGVRGHITDIITDAKFCNSRFMSFGSSNTLNFAILHRNSWSPLQHCKHHRATLWKAESFKERQTTKLETVSIAEPLRNRQHARETPNAVNTKREREWEGELKARKEEEGN